MNQPFPITTAACLLGLLNSCAVDFSRKGEPLVDDGSHVRVGSEPRDAAEGATMEAGFDPVPPCYLDKDGDGVGAGEVRPCSDAGDTGVGALVTTNGDCDDDDDTRSPSRFDECGDQIDNDCDGKVDDELNNACRGACTTPLGHQPGEVCDNGLLGACARAGEYVCQGDEHTVCNATFPTGSAELCSDSVDNDCDGLVNEADAVDGLAWYADCDADGYAGAGEAPRNSCTKPPVDAACRNWTRTRPTVISDTDCRPLDPAYHPGAVFGLRPEGSDDPDLNCDRDPEKDTASIAVGSAFGVTINRVCSGTGDCNCARWPGTAPPCSETSTSGYSVYSRTSNSDGQCTESFGGPGQFFTGFQYCR